jgi:GAF domain-containing protein
MTTEDRQVLEQHRPERRVTPTDGPRAECGAIISAKGVRPALEFLNGRTRFRFSGIYRVNPPHLCNVVLFDRENPQMNLSGEVTRLDDTYCALVNASGPFETADSLSDHRLLDHASRSSVISYAGVPLRLSNGHVWGTLCHFDVRPRLLPEGERSVLESVAPLLVESMQRDHTHAAEFIAPSSTARRGSVAPRT